MVKDFRRLFLPPYKSVELYSIFIAIFIIITVPLIAIELNLNEQELTNGISTKMSVQITSPVAKTSVTGSQTIVVEANDQYPLKTLSLLVDNTTLATINNPNSSNHMITNFYLDTTQFKNGDKTLSAKVTNDQGASQNSQTIKVTIENKDIEAPSLSFEELNDGSVVHGFQKEIKLTARDNGAIEKINLSVDGKLVKVFNKSPYSYLWPLYDVKTGTHKLSATAVDLSGNSKTVEVSVYKAAN